VTHPETPDPRWAELADLALVIAREIQFLGYRDPEAVLLTQTEGTVMRYLNAHDGAPPSVIAAATGLQRTNLATVLTGLQRKGLIERRANPDDGRGATIHTTEHGRANYDLVRREWGNAVQEAADGADVEAALNVLRAVATGLTASRPSTPGRPPNLM
jgi:DNA-binding MarR family transcriptional regulator